MGAVTPTKCRRLKGHRTVFPCPLAAHPGKLWAVKDADPRLAALPSPACGPSIGHPDWPLPLHFPRRSPAHPACTPDPSLSGTQPMPTPSSSRGLERGSSPAALAQLEAGVGDAGKWALRARSSLRPGEARATLRTSHYVAAEGDWEGSCVGNDADHLMF